MGIDCVFELGTRGDKVLVRCVQKDESGWNVQADVQPDL